MGNRESGLISVIVPVYKVEPYLRKCLNSIVNQTYRELQIILIDDGSPDNCGKICDEYAVKDDRIVVVHKENGGLSSARNAGLEIAEGKYIGFVDSDDWIELDMYEYLFDRAEKTGAEIAVCAFMVESKRKTSKFGYSEEQFFDSRKAIEELLKDKHMTSHAWNKLYIRKLFDGVRYPVGRVYEDIATTYKLYEKAKYVSVGMEIKYHYRQNSEGITLSKSVINQKDRWRALIDRYEDMVTRYPEYEEILSVSLMLAAVEIWSCIWSVRKELDSKIKTMLDEIAAFSRLHWKKALRSDKIGITGKMRIPLTLFQHGWSFWLAWKFNKLYELKHGKKV